MDIKIKNLFIVLLAFFLIFLNLPKFNNFKIEKRAIVHKKKMDKRVKSRMLFSWRNKRFYDDVKIKKEVEKKAIQKEYLNMPLVAYTNSISYMDGNLTTYKNSPAYYWTRQMCSINYGNGHFMYDDYYAVAMTRSFGNCGDKFKITTNTGNVFKVIKTEQKKESELINSQQHPDGSIIEFVIDVKSASNIYPLESGYVLGGNFNRLEHFNGNIIKIEKEISQ